MKKINCFAIIGLIAGLSASAQLDKGSNIDYNPFAQHNWGFKIDRILKYEHNTDRRDDIELGHQTDARLDLEAIYFLTNGFGLGLDYCSDWSCNGIYSDRSWTISPILMYGQPIGANHYIYGKVSVGFGVDKSIQGVPGDNNNIEDKSDLFDLKTSIGFPIRLQKENNGYFTPELFWHHDVTDFDDGKDVENAFGVNFKFQTYLGRNQFTCGLKQDYNMIHSRYDQGSQFIDFPTMGGFHFGSGKETFNNSPGSNEWDFSGGNLRLNYGYYIADNFAIGAGLGFRSSVEKPNSNSKYSLTGFSFSPQITANLPAKNCWNNLFAEVEGGYGTQKNKTETGSNTSTSKLNTVNYGAYIGYNDMFSKNVGITPSVGYQWSTTENPDTDLKIKSRGAEVRLGLRLIF